LPSMYKVLGLILIITRKQKKDWEYTLVVEHLPSMCKP
jgi:hypothetical protein